MNFFKAIIFIFTDREIRAKAILYTIGLFLLFGIPTALLQSSLNPFIRTIPATQYDYFFLFTTSILGGIYFAIPSKCNLDQKAVGGSFLGFLAFSCPTCNYLLVLLLGTNLLLNYFNPIRPLIGIVSVLVLAYVLNKKLEGIK